MGKEGWLREHEDRQDKLREEAENWGKEIPIESNFQLENQIEPKTSEEYRHEPEKPKVKPLKDDYSDPQGNLFK